MTPPTCFQLPYLQHFGGHVDRGPADRAGVVLSERVLAEHPGDAKVGYLPVDEPFFGVPLPQNVVRLQISVYDGRALGVQVLDGVGQLT